MGHLLGKEQLLFSIHSKSGALHKQLLYHQGLLSAILALLF